MAKRRESKATQKEPADPEATVSSFLERFIEEMSGVEVPEQIAIFTHRSPDPDAMAAAMGMQWLLQKKFGLSSTIFQEGEVSHPQNKTMVNILGVQMVRAEDFDEEKFSKVIIVDATTKNSIQKADVIIDHHRVSLDQETSCVHIEPVGAASTLIYEYISGLELAFEEDQDQTIATALFLGIRSDTQELIGETTTDRDFKAFQELTQSINRKKLSGVLTYPLPVYFFELERELGRQENMAVGHACFAGCVGIITPAKRDSLPMLSEKMVRMDGVDTAIIFAIVGDHLEASVRSQNASLDVGSFCQSLFGKSFAGGKLGSGAARVPLGIFNLEGSPDEIRDELWTALKKQIFHRILHIAGGN